MYKVNTHFQQSRALLAASVLVAALSTLVVGCGGGGGIEPKQPQLLDPDGDGIDSSVDACPLVPEDFDGVEDQDGCPDDDTDPDRDGILGDDDDCPLAPEDFDGVEDQDGCPDIEAVDPDGDGIATSVDGCPLVHEDFDGVEDQDGCPDDDTDPDRDGILGDDDDCPFGPEDFDGVEDQDGCPDLEAVDPDGDGIDNDVDGCPFVPEDFDGVEDQDGCPDDDTDPDRDGISGDDDDCPFAPEDFDGVEDQDGCPDIEAVDPDGDGIDSDVDGCPLVPEDFDGVEDQDGCPDDDTDPDRDGILGDDDDCPLAPETFNGFEDQDGCPDTKPVDPVVDPSSSADFCWLDSYGRGVGTVPGTCRSGEVKIGLFCYATCQSGYNAEDLLCVEPCPSGYADDGLTCRKDPIIEPQESYTRGVGTIPTICPSTKPVNINGLCYPKCNSGYARDGLFCKKPCPSGYTTYAATCTDWDTAKTIDRTSYHLPLGKAPTICPSTKPVNINGLCYPKCNSGYARSGLFCKKSCPSGYTTYALTCTDWDTAKTIARTSYHLPLGKAPTICPSTKPEKTDGLCYTKCRSGYKGEVTTCVKSCPDGYIDDTATCRKPGEIVPQPSYAREPILADCAPNLENDAGLCYGDCDSGFDGIGPVCSGNCPPEAPVECGAGCAKSASACSNAVISQVTSTVSLAANIAAIVLTYGGSAVGDYVTGLSIEAAERAALESSIKDVLRKAEQGIGEASLSEAATALTAAATNGEPMDWSALDPVGVSAVLKAFDHSPCSDL
jgi:hypothetical protein